MKIKVFVNLLSQAPAAYLALCGPTLACSNDDEAWI